MSETTTAKVSFSELAYRELRRRILENELPAGFQATEQEVAALLDMSRTPTREALVRLASERLVEIRPRHGMRVLPVSAEDMREIYQVLTGLEASAAASVAAKGLSDGELGQLEQAVSDMEDALRDDDLENWAKADERFHALLVDFSGNERLKAVVETFLGQAHRVRRLTLKLRPKPTRSNLAHAAVVKAIKEGDREKAWRVHMKHREESGEMLVGLLQDLGLTQL
ncbi:MAG: GntR family transcriptional regulator [Kiloniellales bacterium]|nr:GntR family transcriptional regulator [Kiloniellales bacterium]